MGASRLNQGLADTPNPWPELDLQEIYGKARTPPLFLLHFCRLPRLAASAFLIATQRHTVAPSRRALSHGTLPRGAGRVGEDAAARQPAQGVAAGAFLPCLPCLLSCLVHLADLLLD